MSNYSFKRKVTALCSLYSSWDVKKGLRNSSTWIHVCNLWCFCICWKSNCLTVFGVGFHMMFGLISLPIAGLRYTYSICTFISAVTAKFHIVLDVMKSHWINKKVCCWSRQGSTLLWALQHQSKKISWPPLFKSPGSLPQSEESNHLLAAPQPGNMWSYPR